jgi:hypothetical protein
MKVRRACSITDCNKPGSRAVTTNHPLCENHYQQQIRRAENLIPQIIEYRCTRCGAAVRAEKRTKLVCVKCNQTLHRWQ